SLRGMLFQAAIAPGDSGFRVRAKELVRTGRNTFTVTDGIFSTCRCEPGERLPWEIRSKTAEVDLESYGVVRNSSFNVLGVPILWVPWAFFPIESERETGLLLPTIAFGGRGGTHLGVPFFWAALPQLNVTLTSHFYSERGFKQDVELEYVFGAESEGRLLLAGLAKDREAVPGGTFERERWAVLWEHDQALPAQWRWQSDLKISSDNLYPDDFIELRPLRTFRFIESTTNVARSFGASGGYGAMLGARYADDNQGASFRDHDQLILQRWAEVRADMLPGTIRGAFGIESSVDVAMIHFSSSRRSEDELRLLAPSAPAGLRGDGRFADFGYDGNFGQPGRGGEGDGLFQPGEPLLDRGTRIVIHPRIARRFRIAGVADFLPEIGWQETLYRTNTQQFAERGLLTARFDLRSRLSRDYFGAGGRALRHVLEPRLGWALVSQRQQKQNPLLVPRGSVGQSRLRALSLENVTRDPADRIEEVNQLVLSLGQRFYVRPRARAASRLRAELLTAVDFDFAGNGGLGKLYLEGRLFPGSRISSRIRSAFNPQTGAVDEGEIGFRWRVPGVEPLVRRLTIGTKYRYRHELPRFAERVRGSSSGAGTADTELNQLDLNATIELTERIRVRLRGTYSFAEGSRLIRSGGVLDYVSKCRCWGVGLNLFQEREEGVGAGVEIRILGLGDQGGSLFDSGFGFGQRFRDF
ncbi:MAG: LPS assembly protein LptD, partial [Myxococcota bacterium]